MKLGRIMDRGIPAFSGILLSIIVVLTFLQVVLRDCFKSGMNWSDEVSQFSMTWLALFGSIWVTEKAQHLNTGLKLHRKLNKWQICVIDGVIELVIAGSAAVVAYRSAIFAFTAMGADSLSLPWLKMGYIFIALPIFMLAVVNYYLKSFFKNLAFILKKEHETETGYM
jgi:TRAP-type C4-dicarboxylate transport system permease small subunit